MTSKNRLEFLESLAAAGKADSFARYALALEYQKSGQAAAAVATFEALRKVDPDYLPMYFMSGQLLSTLGQLPEAIEWLEAGLVVAERKGDGKTSSELTGLLAELKSA